MHDICTLQMCEFMFKFNSSLLQVNVNIFQENSSVHHYDTRQANDYHCFYARTRVRQTTVRFRGGHLNGKNYSHTSNCVDVCIYSGVKLNGHCCRHIIHISLVCSLYNLLVRSLCVCVGVCAVCVRACVRARVRVRVRVRVRMRVRVCVCLLFKIFTRNTIVYYG